MQFSLYIPRIHVKHGRDFIANRFFYSYDINVDRVDFVPIIAPQKEGENKTIAERTMPNFRSAFIYGSSDRPMPFTTLPEKGLKLYVSNHVSQKLKECEFWLCLPNKKPIDDRTMCYDEAIMNLNVIQSRLATDEEREIHSYLLFHTNEMATNHTYEYVNHSNINAFQLCNNIKMLFKRVTEREQSAETM